MNKYLLFWLSGCLLLVQACTVSRRPFYARQVAGWQAATPKDSSRLTYTVFLIGDVGAPSLDKQEPSLKLLQSQLQEAGERSAAIFLGDNIYQYGLPEPGAFDRKLSEQRMNEQLNVLIGYPGEKYMIPGNHDWSNGGERGLEAVLRQEQYVEKYLDDTTVVHGGNFYVPDNGCPGPYEVLLQDDLLLIALNSQWWLHPHERPYGPNNYCNIANEADFLAQIEDLIRKHQNKHIMVVGHHPLASRGEHGGYFKPIDHIFPLSLLFDWAYLPLPVIGSIYPLGRMYGGVSQDIPHPKYQAYIKGLMSIFRKYENVVYAAGHEHNLQYFKIDGVSQIVSGSGCKRDSYKKNGEAIFAQGVKGFARVNYYANGEAWVEFWAPGTGDGSTGEIIFRMPMYTRKTKPAEKLAPSAVDYRDSTITATPAPGFRPNRFKKFFLGEQYRQVWSTPVKMDLLDLKREGGGLFPYKRGSGKQTASLQLRNAEGREYSLRTVSTAHMQTLPEGLRQTMARELLQDQIYAQHPYGALVLPKLSDAAGVLHVKPELVYVPNDPQLGNYQAEFSNTVAILEAGPAEDYPDERSPGFTRNLIGTDRMLERLRQDSENATDQKAFARARLLDMFIGDWDRHEGQWQWVEHKTDGGSVFEPVPRDRDVAFFKGGDGLIPYLTSRKWAVRNIQSFGYDYGDLIGLNLTALALDRSLLAGLSKEDWIAIAREMQAALTDEVLEAAIRDWPPEIYAVSGSEVIAKLKSRRDLLLQAANDYYRHLAKVVEIAGSDTRERFEIKRLNNHETAITVFDIKANGETGRILYQRTLYTDETQEVRIYGLGGEDAFEVSGEVEGGILVRIIGGEGHDHITDRSRTGGFAKKTYVYDTQDGNTFVFGPTTRDQTAAYPEINNYDRQDHQVPYLGPRMYLEYNVDDGLLLSAGVTLRTHAFRKAPFAQQHFLRVRYATATAAHHIEYQGTFTQALGRWDLNVEGAQEGPQFLYNFFGLGNEARRGAENVSFYRVRFARFRVSPTVSKNLASFFKVGFGPQFEQFEVEPTPGRFVATPEAGVDPGTFRTNRYLGFRFFAHAEAMNNPVNPRIGIKFLNEISFHRQLAFEKWKYTNLQSEFVFYLTPNLPFQATLAFRLGGAHNIGDFRFYQANTLGGTDNLRGFRRTRFAGRSSVYQNTEIRVQVFRYQTYLFPLQVGVLGLIDHGRVLADGDRSSQLHRGVGGGIWVDLLNQAVLNATYTAGGEEKLYNLNFGFFF